MENIPEEKIISGKNSVLELLLSGKEIDTLFISSVDENKKIFALAKKNKILIKEVSREKLNSLAGEKNQGVVAIISPFKYCSVDDILKNAEQKSHQPFIIIADCIEDPHNLGAIIRTAEAGGADGVIIPKRRNAALNATVYKTSAGAVSWMKVARVTNLNETIKYLKSKNIWVYGAEADGDSVYHTNLSGAVALVIGSEGKGLSPLVRKNCDKILSLPMLGNINSLNASVSAGILIYEVVKSRMTK